MLRTSRRKFLKLPLLLIPFVVDACTGQRLRVGGITVRPVTDTPHLATATPTATPSPSYIATVQPSFTPTPVPTNTPSPTYTPTSKPNPNRKLRVDGNKIVTMDGEPVNLRGLCIFDPMWDAYSSQICTERTKFEGLVAEYNPNVLRLAIHPTNWDNFGSETYFTFLDKLLESANSHGIYVIVDWHAFGHPENPDANDPNSADIKRTMAFWSKIAGRYKGNPGVIFELYNEPHNIDWRAWKPVAEKLIDGVRDYDPESLIVVGGPDWSYDFREAGSSPIDKKNIGFSVHPYPWKPRDWDTYFGYLTDKYPVIATEWGWTPGWWPLGKTDEQMTYGTLENYGIPLRDYMARRGVHWTAWTYFQGSLKGPDLSSSPDFNQLVKDSLKS